MWGYGYRPYVPVAKRRANALVEMNKLKKKKGTNIQPVRIEGRTIARTFWGKAWCDQPAAGVAGRGSRHHLLRVRFDVSITPLPC